MFPLSVSTLLQTVATTRPPAVFWYRRTGVYGTLGSAHPRLQHAGHCYYHILTTAGLRNEFQIAAQEAAFISWGRRSCIRPAARPCCELILFLARLLATALAGQGFFNAFLFARFQIERVTLYFLDDVFRLHLALESAERIFQRLAFLNSNFSQTYYTPRPVVLTLVVIAAF